MYIMLDADMFFNFDDYAIYVFINIWHIYFIYICERPIRYRIVYEI